MRPNGEKWIAQTGKVDHDKPDRYRIPADKIDAFNKYVEKTNVQQLPSGGGGRRRR